MILKLWPLDAALPLELLEMQILSPHPRPTKSETLCNVHQATF